MLVELHLLQNFAPANLNRDDTGAPKDCEFGGHRRARISSQCQKRAMRTFFRDEGLFTGDQLASRTKRIVDEVGRRLATGERTEDQARLAVETLLQGIKIGVKDDRKTEYLLFLGADEVAGLTRVCETHWADLLTAATGRPEDEAAAAGSARKRKAAAKEEVPAAARAAVMEVLGSGKAVDLALFGRMLADLPLKNVEAASQVAHAISTNRVEADFDFYTAVDDLRPGETTGSDMLGTVEFNSSCFYRYANVDVDELTRNLNGDRVLAGETVAAFLRAAILAIPTGKQNSFAAHNKPSFVFAVVRDREAWSLANAFVQPIRPRGEDDLVGLSIGALTGYWDRMTAMYGDEGVTRRCVMVDPAYAGRLNGLAAATADGGMAGLIRCVMEAAGFGATGGA